MWVLPISKVVAILAVVAEVHKFQHLLCIPCTFVVMSYQLMSICLNWSCAGVYSFCIVVAKAACWLALMYVYSVTLCCNGCASVLHWDCVRACMRLHLCDVRAFELHWLAQVSRWFAFVGMVAHHCLHRLCIGVHCR